MEKSFNSKILVVGDVMIDKYSFGEVSRISPEAPIPVFKENGKETISAGGAANVAVNLSSIGVNVGVCAIIGDDKDGRTLRKLLEDRNIDTKLLFNDENRPTTKKLRYIGPNNQQMLRVDAESVSEPSEGMQEHIIQVIEGDLKKYELIVISDYAKGVLSDFLTSKLINLASLRKIPVFVDVKGNNPKKYRGATLLKPNRKELEELTGIKTSSFESVIDASCSLCRTSACRYVLATLGADGMILVDENGLIKEVKSTASEVFDVTGAGDTSMAYLAAEYSVGDTLEEAMIKANIAAGIQVSKVGTSIVDPCEVYDKYVDLYGTSSSEHIETEEVIEAIRKQKTKGKRVVFTNGCFDILHAGHVSYLKKAKNLGDILVVGVNDDFSVKRLKGKNRPVNPLEDRVAVLGALRFVDYTIPFSEDTPYELIEKIIPDILVKGGDYKIDDIVGADIVREHGGKVVVLDFLDGRSTTSMIKKINKIELNA